MSNTETDTANRIDRVFEQCRADNRAALVMYVTAGDPDLAFTERLLPAIAASGADVIEIGVPFSDPMADGPAIQEASQRALKSGTTMKGILNTVRAVRDAGVTTPFVLFSYYNVILQYGVERLARDSRDAGIDGWLVVDLPHEEQNEIMPALHENGLHRITLLAPTTPEERLRKLAGDAKGFIYYITVTGVTGVRNSLPADLAQHLKQVMDCAAVPVVAGFGVSTPEMAHGVAEHANGVVVGSKLVKTIAEAPDRDSALDNACKLVKSLADALR